MFLHELDLLVAPGEPALQLDDPFYQHLTVGLHLFRDHSVLMDRFLIAGVFVGKAVGLSGAVLRHSHCVQGITGAGPRSHTRRVFLCISICFQVL